MIKNLLITLLVSTSLFAQFGVKYWKPVGVGNTASRPATCTSNKDTYINTQTNAIDYCIAGVWTALAAGGAGTVTSVDASGGVETDSGSAITSTGTVRGSIVVNAQTGTTYTVLTGDRGKLVTHTNGSAIAVTLPQAGGTFPANWYFMVQNRGAGTVTITPTTSTIDGAASLALLTNQGTIIVSDGTNYFTQRGLGAATGLGDPGANGIVYRDGAGTSRPATTDDLKAVVYISDAGGDDAYSGSPSFCPASIQAGQHYRPTVTTANTGAATLDPCSFGAKTIKKVAGGITTDLADNDIRSGQFVELVYDGTNMQMQSTLGNAAAGGGIDPSISDTYANIIAATCTATEEGQIGVPTNSYYSMARCDGSAWDWFLGGRSVTIPASGDYAWVNQNSATLDTTGGGIYLEAIATGSNSLSQRVKSTAATPFTVTMAIAPNVWSSDQSVGIMLRESGTSKILTFGPEVVSAVAAKYSVIKWTNSTTFSAYQAQNIGAAAVVSRPVWLRVTHDGTNIVWKLSNDGANFITVSTATKTNFFTTDADQIGFYAKSGSSNQIVGVTILSVD